MSPGTFQNSTCNQTMTVSFSILSNSIFTNHPTIPRTWSVQRTVSLNVYSRPAWSWRWMQYDPLKLGTTRPTTQRDIPEDFSHQQPCWPNIRLYKNSQDSSSQSQSKDQDGINFCSRMNRLPSVHILIPTIFYKLNGKGRSIIVLVVFFLSLLAEHRAYFQRFLGLEACTL